MKDMLRNTEPHIRSIHNELYRDNLIIQFSEMPKYEDLKQYLNLYVAAGGELKRIYGKIERYETDEDGWKWFIIHEEDNLMYSKWSLEELQLVKIYERKF